MVTKYRPDGFGIKELVDEQTFNSLGEEAWNLFSIKTLITLNTIKKLTGWTIIVNTWSFKNWQKYGKEKWSQRGFRASTSTTGLKTGAHPKGLGIDFDAYDKDGKHISADNVRKFIMDNINKFEYICCLEIDIEWVHFDCMDWSESEHRLGITHKNYLLYSPKTKSSKVVQR